MSINRRNDIIDTMQVMNPYVDYKYELDRCFRDLTSFPAVDPNKWNMVFGMGRVNFEYKKVIFNPPATIVIWKDGTKTVVKCSPDDEFDPEKGLAFCFMKKAMGNSGAYNKVLKKETSSFQGEYITVMEAIEELTRAYTQQWQSFKELWVTPLHEILNERIHKETNNEQDKDS